MEKEKCVISVITVVYNDCNHIETTIKNVLSQDYKDIEYIVIDGDSTDGTKEIIALYSFRLKFISEPDTGIYNAMNKGLKMATGDYLVFMNSGDLFTHTNTLSIVASHILNRTERPAMVYGNYRESKDGYFSPVIPARSYKKVWYGAFASHQSTFYNRKFLLDYNLIYDESYKIAADYKLNIEVVKYAKDNILQIFECISDFDVSGVSNTNQNLGLLEADRARREVLNMSAMRRYVIKYMLLCARWAKLNMRPIYNRLRMR